MTNGLEKREFDRNPMDLIVEVSADDKLGNTFKDKPLLKDISGGGLKFLSKQTEKYFSGQSLEIIIELPGTRDVKAQMKGKATVVRIDLPEDSENKEPDQESNVAARLDTPFVFERLQ